MIGRKGSSLVGTIVSIAAVGGLGVFGAVTMMNGGVCGMMGGSCGDKAPTANVVAVGGADAGGSCCPLGDMAKADNDANVIAASSKAADCASSCCSSGEKPAAQVIAASGSEKGSCASACGSSCDKPAAQMIAASGAAKSCCGDKSSCSDKASCGSGTQMIAASTASKMNCASVCGEKSACGDAKMVAHAGGKRCPVDTFNGHMNSFTTMVRASWTPAAASGCCDSSGAKAQQVAAKVDSCCGGGAAVQQVAAKADSGCCKGSGVRADGGECCGGCDGKVIAMASTPVSAHMGSTSGIFVPAMFFDARGVDRAALKGKSCGGCSDKAACGEKGKCCGDCGDKAACSKGMASVDEPVNAG